MWPLSNEECYVSIDIEADGPIPGAHSMLSLGAAALDAEGVLRDTFAANLEQLDGATEDPRTMRWWASQSTAWEVARADPQPPERAIKRFSTWVEHQHDALGLPVLVAYPAAYDAMWVEWYCHRFAGSSPFRRRAIDLKTLAMVAMGAGYRTTTKSRLPKHWRPPATHTHVALDDAIEQGELFFNIVRELNIPARRCRAGGRRTSDNPDRPPAPAPGAGAVATTRSFGLSVTELTFCRRRKSNQPLSNVEAASGTLGA